MLDLRFKCFKFILKIVKNVSFIESKEVKNIINGKNNNLFLYILLFLIKKLLLFLIPILKRKYCERTSPVETCFYCIKITESLNNS